VRKQTSSDEQPGRKNETAIKLAEKQVEYMPDESRRG